jgi:3-oxoacyl-[acyl-carrier protein] reductase
VSPGPLAGRGALVTGVSRRIGIGWAIAHRLGGGGDSVSVFLFREHEP